MLIYNWNSIKNGGVSVMNFVKVNQDMIPEIIGAVQQIIILAYVKSEASLNILKIRVH